MINLIIDNCLINCGSSNDGDANLLCDYLSFQMVRDVLKAKPGGQNILDEYDKMKTLMDNTRRQLVNLLVADMVEIHG